MSAKSATQILIVDDDVMMRYNIAGYLEDSGYDVCEAMDGVQAIDMVRCQPPDLVLCDLRMPRMDGIDVLQQLHSEFPDLPVIAVSGAGVLSDAVEALRAGAWDFVVKPIQEMAVLEHAVIAALEKAKLIQDNRRYQQDLEQANLTLQHNLQHMREDTDAARRIQLQIMPEHEFLSGPYEVTRCLKPSMIMSGDFVDYFSIGPGHIGFYLADVSGHGVSSAFVTVLLKSYVIRQLERFDSHSDNNATVRNPQRMLTGLNQYMLDHGLEKYLTIFYGVINIQKNHLDYSFGGHFPAPVLFDGTSAHFLSGRGPPIGMFRDSIYDAGSLSLPKRFALALFSDGILEVFPKMPLLKKQARLLKALDSIPSDAEKLMAHVGLRVDQSYPDDITLLLLKRNTQA